MVLLDPRPCPHFGATILVTGAASGIGAAAATRFAADGARKLILADRDEDRLRDFAFSLPCERQMLIGDVGDEELWASADLTGLTHALVNAGIGAGATDRRDQLRRLAAGDVDQSRRRLPDPAGGDARDQERRQGGAIVLTASVAGVKAEPGIAAYGASKAAVIHLARIAAKEGGPDRIRVNSIAPGGVETPIWHGLPFFQDLVKSKGSEAEAFARDGRGRGPRRPLRPARGDRRPDRLPAVRRMRLRHRLLLRQRRRLFALSFAPRLCGAETAAARRARGG